MMSVISKDLIGRESKPIRVKIEDFAVRRFVEAVGVPFDNKVPPTFIGSLMSGNFEEINLIPPGAIHGEQIFTYFQPVSIGDWITYTRRIKAVGERIGKMGRMIVMVVETIGCNPTGEQIFNIISTISIPDWRSRK